VVKLGRAVVFNATGNNQNNQKEAAEKQENLGRSALVVYTGKSRFYAAGKFNSYNF